MKKIYVLLAALVVILSTLIAGTIVSNNLNPIFYSNVEALAMIETTNPNGQLYSNSAGNLYCCKPGVAQNCNTSVTPECPF